MASTHTPMGKNGSSSSPGKGGSIARIHQVLVMRGARGRHAYLPQKTDGDSSFSGKCDCEMLSKPTKMVGITRTQRLLVSVGAKGRPKWCLAILESQFTRMRQLQLTGKR